MFTFYQVGGAVRDEILGLKSKDIDYVAVFDTDKIPINRRIEDLFDLLVLYLNTKGYEIFLTTPRMYTIRARFPKDHKNAGTTADFVIARKEIGYKEGTREPIVVPGTLLDDLTRRDFTVNAIAKAEDGTIIDPFDGRLNIERRFLQTPLPAEQTFNDDPLRILRAIRFAVTKGFTMSAEIIKMIQQFDYMNKFSVVSEDRIREELNKCFHCDTLTTLDYLQDFYNLRWYILTQTKIWFKPTNEE